MSEMTQTVTGATQPQSDDASRITARDLRSVFWRSFTLQGSWNYERQQHMGYAFAMSPALKRIYQDPTELGRALQRHLVLFNTTPHLSTFIFGLSIAMEEENQRNPEFNEESINAIKTSLMGHRRLHILGIIKGYRRRDGYLFRPAGQPAGTDTGAVSL